ncbi:MAG TPA: hypothetical protein PKI15_00765 [Candidatus Cloacimonadota bacterium]|nr:hypothetical protein [Candidatus Cloacimonadota bacterium]
MRAWLTGLLFLMIISLNAVITENSASLNGLNGITALSTCVSDYALSPVIGVTGFSSSFTSHFGTHNGSVFGLHTAQNLDFLIFAAGFSYTSSSAYRWQDQYMTLALGFQDMGIGYTQHHLYEKVGSGASRHDWVGDIGLKMMYEGYGSEVKMLRMGSKDRQIHLTTMARPYQGVTVATTYVWGPEHETSFATATTYEFFPEFQMQVSWQSDPSRLGIGVRANIGNIELGYAVRTHPELNLTHALDIGVRW